MPGSDKKIGVCFVAPKAYPLFNPDARNVKDPFGGSEVDLYLLAIELAKDERFEVSFITADYDQHETEIIHNVKVIKSIDFSQNFLKGIIRIWRAMKKTDAAIYMLKTAGPGVPLVALFCRIHNRVFVYRTASDVECNGRYIAEHPVLGRAFKLSLRSAKAVFTQNETDRENLERTTQVRSTFIRNGHYISEPVCTERDIILWIARSSPEKRPELFIRLAEQFPEQKFVMVCPRALGDERYEQVVSAASNVKNLTLIRSVPFDQTSNFFRRAKVFVCTSEREGFPNTYIQAGINAVPILSLSTNPDGVLDKYGCGLCCADEFSRLVESLRIMLNQNCYRQMGLNAWEYVRQHHDITKIAERYKALFWQLIKNESS